MSGQVVSIYQHYTSPNVATVSLQPPPMGVPGPVTESKVFLRSSEQVFLARPPSPSDIPSGYLDSALVRQFGQIQAGGGQEFLETRFVKVSSYALNTNRAASIQPWMTIFSDDPKSRVWVTPDPNNLRRASQFNSEWEQGIHIKRSISWLTSEQVNTSRLYGFGSELGSSPFQSQSSSPRNSFQ